MRTIRSVRVVLLAGVISVVLWHMPGTSTARAAARLDPSWGRGGLTSIDFGNIGFRPASASLDRRGAMVVGGGYHGRMVRITPAGLHDRSWASNGYLAVPTKGAFRTMSVSSGSYMFLLHGRGYYHRDRGYAIQLLDSRGRVVRSFGSNGTSRIAFAAPEGYEAPHVQATGCVVRADARSMTIASYVGWARPKESQPVLPQVRGFVVTHEFLITLPGDGRPMLRLQSTKSVEVLPDYGEGFCGYRDASTRLDKGGRFWDTLPYSRDREGTFSPPAVRRWIGRELDQSFGPRGDGMAELPIDRPAAVDSLRLTARGPIVLFHDSPDAPQREQRRSWALAAFDWDGSLRSDFGQGGRGWLSGGLSREARATDMYVHRDGTIDIALVDEMQRIVRLERRQPDGTPDLDFAPGGRVHLAVPARTYPRDLMLRYDRQGRIYALTTLELIDSAHGRLVVRRLVVPD